MKQKEFPRIGLGTYGGSGGVEEEVVYEAIKRGYRHFDCASIYGNEDVVGIGLQRAMRDGIVKREDIWVTSKVWNDAHRPQDVRTACERTLRDLGLAYLDLYVIHWPIAVEPGTNKIARIPLQETWRAMESLVDEGLVRNIGVSNFDIQLLHDLLQYCRIRPFVNQVECHVYLQQRPLLAYCESQHIYLTAYCPLARPGRYRRNAPLAIEEPAVVAAAKAHNKTPRQVLLQWLLQRSPYLAVIPKTSKIERLSENFQVTAFELTSKEVAEIEKLNANRRIIITPGPIEVFT